MPTKLETDVRRRARDRCEYCGLPEVARTMKHVLDHVIAVQHHGPTSLENLALACIHCNRHKGPNLSGVDPDSGSIEILFNPRRDLWQEHFGWDGALLVGLSPRGRATIDVLKINRPARVATRRGLMNAGKFFDL
jgi:hypothetical protein